MMKIEEFEIVITDKISQINHYLKPYNRLIDYRQIFISKEWVSSYFFVYNPECVIFIYDTHNKNYICFEKRGETIQCLGDPLNDYNLVNSNIQYSHDYWVKIINLVKQSFQEKVLLNCLSMLIDDYSPTAKYVGLKTDVSLFYNQKISSKYKKMLERYGGIIKYNTVTPKDAHFNQILEDLLIGRNTILSAKAPDDNRFSLDDKFKSFIHELTNKPSISENLYIDYGQVDNKIVSIVLYFRNQDCALYYLRWCVRSSNKISYGPLLDIWSINKCFADGCRIIDFSRGGDSYKYRLGFKEYLLYNYIV